MRLKYAIGLKEEAEVSIHASVKDATPLLSIMFLFWTVSIHASVKDATIGKANCYQSTLGFNPRICKRCD